MDEGVVEGCAGAEAVNKGDEYVCPGWGGWSGDLGEGEVGEGV